MMSPPTTQKRTRSPPPSSRKKIKSISQNDAANNDSKLINKTHATGGYCGTEYEIKLSALIWLNLKYDDDVKDFLLATNVMAACPLDDICFKITWKNEKRKPTIVFIQLKHKINELKPSIKLDEMFSAYENIKTKMNGEEDDGLFEGQFDEFELYSILYSNKDFTLKTDLVTVNNYWSKLNDIFGTSGSVRKLSEKGKEEIIKNMRKNNRTWSENELNAFIKSLLIFSRQADEMGVEEILKELIDKHPRGYKNPFPLEPHPVTLTFIRMFVNWWKEVKRPYYLTKKDDLLENAFKAVLKSPWISTLNILYTSKINNRYKFTDVALSSLNLRNRSITIIISENSKLTVLKLMQYFKTKEHAVLDLENIASLPTKDQNELCTELTKTNDDKVIVFVCDKPQQSNNEIKILEHIAKYLVNNKTVIITNTVTVHKLRKYFSQIDRPVHDEKNSLLDMCAESQKRILENSRVIFQDVEVGLDLIVDEKSKAYVKEDILYKIITNDTIKLSKLSVSRDYDEMKHLYVDRWVQVIGPNGIHEASLRLKSLYDIEKDVVLVTAEPGMGKSTLLTHLSLNTKMEHPQVWIVRINLLECTRELYMWKKDEIAVNLLDTLKFMCQVILREKLGKDIEIALEDRENGIVTLKHCSGDQLTQFELKLFLHYFTERKIIFLFDGFDEICPHYKNEVIKCIRVVSDHPNRHKIWVTSRSYAQIKTTLQNAFGAPYEIEHFSYKTKKQYLNKIWKFNLILEELDRSQMENVRDFLDFMSNSEDRDLQLFGLPLHEIYINAYCYLINKINDSSNFLWPFDRNYNDNYYKKEENLIFKHEVYEENSDKNPLHLFLRAHFFIASIKNVSKKTNRWNGDFNTFTFYQQYLETKLKKIRFEEKNNMDTTKPDIMIIFDKELAEFIATHKKMAAYAIFNQDIDIIFSNKDLEDIKESIKFMEKGGEKTGFVFTIATIKANKTLDSDTEIRDSDSDTEIPDSYSDTFICIPIFIHMTFAEYFAMEYVCDSLKNATNTDTQTFWIDFIFNVLFSAPNFANVRNMFDYKMKIDEKLSSIIEKNEELIFNLLMEQGIVYSEYLDKVLVHKTSRVIKVANRKKRENSCYWPPFEAVQERLRNFTSFFATVFERNVNINNLDEFLEILTATRLLSNAIGNECDEIVIRVLHIVRNLDISKLNPVLRQNFCYLSRSRTYDNLNAQEIMELIRKDLDDEYKFNQINGNCPQIVYGI